MRKNKMMRLASGLLVAVLLTTSMISGTFAKYISEKSGSDSARVAKWSFKVNDTDITTATEDFSFNLFNTINDTDGSVEDDVDTDLIAPGTQGSFVINIANLSEVTAKYKVAFTETNAQNIPIEYCLNPEAPGATWVKAVDGKITGIDVPETEIPMKTGTTSVTVYWKWVYENNVDPADTALGIKAQGAEVPAVNVKATITATQVD